MNIQEIQITKFPGIMFSDSHTNLSNIRKLKELYPDIPIISLGDICFLFSKKGEIRNAESIQYLIDNNIPTLLSNHEQHILSCSVGDSFTLKFDEASILTDEDKYGLSNEHINFLRKLPIGFKLILPDGRYYLLFHHSPTDLWGRNEKGSLTEKQFKEIYNFDENCIACIHGHLHSNFIEEYPNIRTKRISIGQLCNSNHHTGENTGGNYAILTEKGLEYKKI